MKVSLKAIIRELETLAPPVYQESYDNSGLLVGDRDMEITGALLSLDCTEEIIEEAKRRGCNLVVAHHPIIFGGLKRLTGSNYVERTVMAAIRHNIAIYAAHTNLDNVRSGVNAKIAAKLGLINTQILAPKSKLLKKLVTFAPEAQAQQVREGLFRAGAGHIGNYDQCSFNSEGTGTFRAGASTQPFVGEQGKLHQEKEIRIEVIYENWKESTILRTLKEVHPYEEVAYDLYALENSYTNVGSGMIGELPEALPEMDFLRLVKQQLKAGCLKYTALQNRPIRKVALCGGSGSFLLKTAIANGADAYVSADFKYHEFFDAEGKIVVVDAGHFETEQFTPEIFSELFSEKFPTFATYLSELTTNPVNYF